MAPLMASSYSTTCQLISCNNAFNQTSSRCFDEPSVWKQSSPANKAVRVAMLKARFADLIMKAQQTLNINGEKEDSARIKPEKVDFAEKLQRRKQGIEGKEKDDEATHKANSGLKVKIVLKRNAAFLASEKEGTDKARMPHVEENFAEKQKKRRIESQINAGTTTDKADSVRKMNIKKEREAARLALEKVEASVYIDDFNQTYKDFLMLISPQSDGVK